MAFAVGVDSRGLDEGFGVNGVCEVDLGGALRSPVATNDRNEWIDLFAQRLSDLRAVGCRIRVRTGLFPADHGSVDTSFGAGGVVTLSFDSAPATPAAIMHDDAGVAVAVTRSIRGSDCDRVPALVALERADGRPDETFGAGASRCAAPSACRRRSRQTTQRAYARSVMLWFEFIETVGVNWAEVRVDGVGRFVSWLLMRASRLAARPQGRPVWRRLDRWGL